ncbi:MAG TPA: hypothetical protein VHV78_09030, partial [Gemmatimonadaceae bacterium]|nr:hypothetical protein [Gemmatimonadaceae bacterium]
MSSVLAALAIVAAAGCARQHVATQSTIETASGEVGMMYSSENGLWMDRIGGVWLDSSGALRSGGGTGMTIGLTPSTVSQMTNANIVAHVLAGDSLEVRLSQLGETALQQPLVRDFSRRMVADYDADIQAARRAADSARVVPALAARDTFDTAMAGRLTSRIDSLPRVDPFNRGVMAAEVLVHKHLLNDLT